MKLKMRRWLVVVDNKEWEEGRKGDPPLRKTAAIAIIDNPYAGRSVEDLSPLIEQSAQLGAFLAEKAVGAMAPYPIASYGKGGVVGLDGVQEHANARSRPCSLLRCGALSAADERGSAHSPNVARLELPSIYR